MWQEEAGLAISMLAVLLPLLIQFSRRRATSLADLQNVPFAKGSL